MAGMIDQDSVGWPTREKVDFRINILDSFFEKKAWDISAGKEMTFQVIYK